MAISYVVNPRTRSKAADLPQGGRGGRGRERREDGPDDHPQRTTANFASLYESNTGTVSSRRSRIETDAHLTDLQEAFRSHCAISGGLQKFLYRTLFHQLLKPRLRLRF
jgi:hypothetical protein